jgi:Domain of unknown function (DUF1707)
MPDHDGKRFTPRIVPGTALSIPREITILPNGSRAGNADRDRTIRHIQQMTDLGYITPEEAGRRIDHADATEKSADLTALTSDLPAPVDTRRWSQSSYDWDKMSHWLPTLIAGMALFGVIAVVPSAALNAERLFPNTALGLGVGVSTLIVGVIGFFACLAGILIKAD